MSDMRAIINDVYIEPIRSVLIVDDEFVSLDKMIHYSNELKSSTELNDVQSSLLSEYPNLDLTRANRLISSFRSPERSWLCDIHDGRDIEVGSTEKRIAGHLHQSDLLILDYNLTNDPSDGSKALSFIKEVAQNTHFNLVVVYTKSDVVDTFYEILFNLTNAVKESVVVCSSMEQMQWSAWSLEDEELVAKVSEILTIDNALELVNYINKLSIPEDINQVYFESISFYEDLTKIYESKPSILDVNWETYIKLIYLQVHEKYGRMLGKDLLIENKHYIDSGVNWIKNDRLFITVVNKDEIEPDSLTESLLNALTAWNPQPHRLLMSKVRSELENRGVYFEDSILTSNHTHAGWLIDFLKTDTNKSKWVTQQTVSQTVDMLTNSLMPSLEAFSLNLKQELNKADINCTINGYHSLDMNDKTTKLNICKHLNAYRCSQDVIGEQVNTGHIIELEGVFYVCLTPACDLQPGRAKGWKEKLGSLLPAKLVRLFPYEERYKGGRGEEKFLQSLTTNENVIVNIDGKLTGLTLLKQTGGNPLWEQVLLHDEGAVTWDGDNPSIVITRTHVENGSKHTLISSSHKVRIVAQLRYEYALNLLQKFGFSLSRVGLDFVNFQ